MPSDALAALAEEIASCRRCPRLVAHRERVAEVRRAMYRDQTYWGRGVAGFGDPGARLLVVGLAPAAHGGNRTGRMFTGDRSAEFLMAALYRAGYANLPTSVSADDGLVLRDVYLTAPVRCAPPGNRPLPEEIAACRPFFVRELAMLPRVRVLLALGRVAYDQVRRWLARQGGDGPQLAPAVAFAHDAEWRPLGERPPYVVCSYHPSQQNTQTGRLTPAMMDAALDHARRLVSKA